MTYLWECAAFVIGLPSHTILIMLWAAAAWRRIVVDDIRIIHKKCMHKVEERTKGAFAFNGNFE